MSVVFGSIVPGDAKWAFTTRRVVHSDVKGLKCEFDDVVSGDLVLGEIIDIGQHKKVQLASGRYSESYLGDLVVMTAGCRYAPDQFEGIAEIVSEGADMLAGGGVLGRMIRSHGRMSRPTRVRPIGLLTAAGGDVVNVADYALPFRSIPDHVRVIGVLGTSMNAGKTTAAVSLAHGLKRAGYRVAGIKATGTGAFGDYNAFADAGVSVLDFTDAGLASTYCVPIQQLERTFSTLVGTAAQEGADIVVVEFADGVFQQEIAAILNQSSIKDRLDTVLFAAPDALSAVGGVSILRAAGLEPFAISGLLTRSPMAVAEAEKALDVPLITKKGLCSPELVQTAVSSLLAPPPHAPLAVAA